MMSFRIVYLVTWAFVEESKMLGLDELDSKSNLGYLTRGCIR